MKINKKIFFIILLILICILGIIIFKYVFKNKKSGYNMNSQEIVDYILNINSYKTKINVEVTSNKNKNKYIIEQEYSKNNGSIQNVIEPSNIAGTTIIKKDNTLKVENTHLNLTKIFENYKGLEENDLDLITFIENYKNNNKSNHEENEQEIILKIKNTENKYLENKKLYIDKETKLPTKLIIEDNNKNIKIFIQYNEVKLNIEE